MAIRGHPRDRTCECERDPITLTLRGVIRGAPLRGHQEAIHVPHLHGVTIEFNQEAINDPEQQWSPELLHLRTDAIRRNQSPGALSRA